MEFVFQLPVGYIDDLGTVHRSGRLRLACAVDEIDAIAHPRVLANEAYLPVVVLSRVITGLGSLAEITEDVVGGLVLQDFQFLEELYLQLNGVGAPDVAAGVRCPHCAATEVVG